MRSTLRSISLVALILAAGPAMFGQSPTSPTDAAQELIELERVRSVVENAFEILMRDVTDGAESLENMVRAADLLENEGPAVVPLLVNELQQGLPDTRFFCSYALGRIGSPEAMAALRQAADRAEEERGPLPKFQKAWACYGLGLAGDPDAVRRINAGRHVVGHYPVLGSTSFLEAIAVRAGRESVPALLEQLERFGREEILESSTRRTFVIRALGLVADPGTTESLIELLREAPLGVHRREAVLALQAVGTKEVMGAIVGALQDADPRVVKSAALALEQLLPREALEPILEVLKTEEDGIARGILNRTVAGLAGPASIDLLRPFWPGSDVFDRMGMIDAMEIADPAGGFAIVRSAIDDSDFRVSIRAVRLLGEIDTQAARELLIRTIDSQHWPLALTAIEAAADHGIPGAGAAIAGRLFRVELAGNVTEPSLKSNIRIMIEKLVLLEYHEARSLLRIRAAKQRDTGLALQLREAATRLDVIASQSGESPESWITVADSTDSELRMLAYRKLAEAASPEATQALCQRFGRVDQEEGLEILRLLGSLDSAATRDLLERVLIEPGFDSHRTLALREMAAWSARRLGGIRSSRALRASIERRDGRDARVMVYFAILDGEAALPVLRAYRASRLRYLGAYRGREMRALDRLSQRIAAGHSVATYDVPPNSLTFP